MLSDYEMIVHQFPERPTIRIYPIADPHLGAKEHMEREWRDFCENLLKDPHGYITLGGDLLNNATKSSVSNCYEEVYRPREQKRMMVEMLTPIKDRILCATTGNHEYRNRDVDDDPTYDILCKLDLEHLYRENMAFVKIQMGNNRNGGRDNPTYCIVVTHGSGGGALTGSAVNKGERFAYMLDGVDCYIQGHTHKPFYTAPEKLKMDFKRNVVVRRPFAVVNASSWLAYGGYAMRKGLAPQGHRPQVITLNGTKKEIDLNMKLLF